MTSKQDEVVHTNDIPVTGLGTDSEERAAGRYEMEAADGVERVELAQAINEIEGKKKAWYAYLTTRDFWIVLLIGFVFLSVPSSLYTRNLTNLYLKQTSPCPLHHRYQHVQLPSCRCRNLHSRFPDSFQLYPSCTCLYNLYNLPIRL
jgi:hypothetical protein